MSFCSHIRSAKVVSGIIPFARHVLRLSPVSASCVASTPEILVLARKLIPSAFASLPEKPDGLRNYRVSSESVRKGTV